MTTQQPGYYRDLLEGIISEDPETLMLMKQKQSLRKIARWTSGAAPVPHWFRYLVNDDGLLTIIRRLKQDVLTGSGRALPIDRIEIPIWTNDESLVGLYFVPGVRSVDDVVPKDLINDQVFLHNIQVIVNETFSPISVNDLEWSMLYSWRALDDSFNGVTYESHQLYAYLDKILGDVKKLLVSDDGETTAQLAYRAKSA